MSEPPLEIRGAKMTPIGKLRPAEWNANRVNAKTMEKIRASMRTFGFVENLVARPHPTEDGALEVLSGNHRLEILVEEEVAKAPVVIVDVDDAHARILAQALNRTRGEDDPLAYARLLAEILEKVGADRVTTYLPETESTIDRALARLKPRSTDPDEIPDPPEEADSKLGEVYELGAHRLVCGDATDPAIAELAFAGDRAAHCVLTDPPYGVSYVGKTADKLTIANDAPDAQALEELLTGSLDLAETNAVAGAPIYLWFGGHEAAFRAALDAAGWRYAQTLIWAKTSMVLSRSDYHWQHEPCLYGWKRTGPHRWFGDRQETTLLDDGPELHQLTKPQLVKLVEELRTQLGSDVLRAPKPASSRLHPTQKPVALLEHLLRNSTEIGNTVYDPFAGSGSTLIAAETTRRRAIVVELEPRYCDVIRQRYEALVAD